MSTDQEGSAIAASRSREPSERTARANADTAVKSADRVLMVLDMLASSGPSTFSEITAALELPNSSAHNLLQTMVRRDYLEFEPGARRFRLGLRLWQVAQAYLGNGDVVAVARPIMDQLMGLTQETVQLARLDGVENTYLAIAESPHPMKLVSEVGSRLYAHATGVGKVLLAALDPRDAESRLRSVELPRFTRNTVTDVPRLMDMLRTIREQGYGEDQEEYVIGCRCIAMPVCDSAGSVVAAMSVSIPTPRYDQEVAAQVHRGLRDSVNELSRRLGSPDV